jgi:hypothetical protein
MRSTRRRAAEHAAAHGTSRTVEACSHHAAPRTQLRHTCILIPHSTLFAVPLSYSLTHSLLTPCSLSFSLILPLLTLIHFYSFLSTKIPRFHLILV